MRLSKDDPIVKILRQSTLDSRFGLPDAIAVQEAQVGPTIQQAVQLEWQDRLANGFNVGTRFSAARVVTNLGYARGPKLDAIQTLFDIPQEALMVGQVFFDLLEDVVGDMVEATLEQIMEILEQALEEVLGALVDIISGIPIYGWIVKIVWNVVRGIRTIADLIKKQNEDPPEKEYPRVKFTPDGDLALCNQYVINRLQSDDWTPIFMPPGIDRNTAWGEYFFGAKLEGGGRRIVTRGSKEGWVGMIPGTTSLHREIEVEPSGYQIRETGLYLPSARNMGAFAWGQVQDRTSPALYAVDAERCKKTWRAYLFNLRLWIMETDTMKESSKRRLVNDPQLVRQFGWGPYDMPFDSTLGFENFGIDDPDQKIKWTRVPESAAKNAPPAQTGVAHPVRAMKEVRRAQWKGLDTLMVAYCSEKSGAFTDFTGDDMKEKLEDRRKLLVGHPAMCDVELSDVIDPQLKAAIEFNRELGNPKSIHYEGPGKYPNCYAGPQGKLAAPKGPFKPNRPDPANPVPSDAPAYLDAVLIKDLVNGSKKKKKKGGPTFIQQYGKQTAAVVALAAVGGLVYKRQKSKKR